MAAELEVELQDQLQEQKEALEGVHQLLAADPASAETAALLAELQAGIADTEEALLGLTRQRLLAELDAWQGDADGTGATDTQQVAEQQRQQQQQQLDAQQRQQQPQQQQAEQQREGGGGGGGSLAAAGGQPEPGSICVFRWTDGRHYLGRVVSSDGSGPVRLQFVHPTRLWQLEVIALPSAALQPTSGSSLQLPVEQQHAGARVLAKPAGGQLWQAAELADVDVAGQRVAAVTISDRRRHILPLTAVALSAHAPDPYADRDGGKGGRWDRDSRAAASSGSEQDGSSGSGGSGNEGFSSFSGDGGDSDAKQIAATGAPAGDGDGDVNDATEDEEASYGAARFGRVSLAMAEADELIQQQAEAGAQSDTRLFFSSESHTRGIGSKLLARMGFRGLGHGLGRQQHGMQQALQATQLKKGAGLGVDGGKGTREGSKKRKRSGKQRRRDKAAKAGLDQREEQRGAQRELERKTGSEGMFAVLNSIIGDSSQAQAVRRSGEGGKEGGGAGGGSGRQAHLFGAGGATAAAAAAVGASTGGKAAPKEDRRALAKGADGLAQLRQKTQRLSEMAARNARDKLMMPQIRRALAEAQAQLAAAESQHAASHKAIHDREKLKRMTKF